MSKKFDVHGRFRGIKIKVDPITGEANVRIHVSELEEILCGAILHEYDSIEKYKKELSNKPAKHLSVEEGLEYCKNQLETLQGLSNWAKSFLTRPKVESRTKEDRLKVVTEIRKERLLIDSIIEEALAEVKDRG